jgi:prepilin-type N-terminal cleavage/methylation domain-containing protein
VPTPSHPIHSRSRGFTIVEVLVVVAIVGLLTTLLITAARAIRGMASGAIEATGLRQVLTGYTLYALDHSGTLLPGYPDPNDVHVTDQDGAPIPHDAWPARSRYPWRLAPYLDYGFETMYVGQQRRFLEDAPECSSLPAYSISAYPSFGLNAEWLGGHKSSTLGWAQDMQLHVTHLAQVRRPAKLLAFASARSEVDAGCPGLHATPWAHGYFEVISPVTLRSTGITWPTGDGAYETMGEPNTFGFVSFRESAPDGEGVGAIPGKALIGTVDGHVESVTVGELADMQRWANPATLRSWHPMDG